MALTCSFSAHPALKKLNTYFAKDTTAYLEHFNKAFKTNPSEAQLEPTAGFATWYKETNGKELNIDKLSSVKLRDAIIAYYNHVVPNYSATDRVFGIEKAARLGYASDLARKTAINYLAVSIYKEFMARTNDRANDSDNLLSDIIVEQIKKVRINLAALLAEGNKDKFAEIWKGLGTNIDETLAAILDEKEDDFTDDIYNWIALYKELTSTDKTENNKSLQSIILDEIMSTKLLSTVKFSKYDNAEDEAIAKQTSLSNAETSEETDPDVSLEDEIQTDGTLRDLNSHFGEYDDFSKHIIARVERLLNTVPKLNTPVENNDTEANAKQVLDYKINPSIGFIEYHDSSELASILYSYVVKDDADSMVASIRTMAESFPEYAGLSILANELERNRDLRYAFYKIFGKPVMSKVQTILNDGVVVYRISNPSANRLENLKNQYSAEFASSAVNLNLDDVKTMLDNLRGRRLPNGQIQVVSDDEGNIIPRVLLSVSKEVGRSPRVEAAVGKMYNILKLFYPSLDKYAVLNYVYQFTDNNGNTDIQLGLHALYNHVTNAVNKAYDLQRAIKLKQDRITDGIAHNRHLIYRKSKLFEDISDEEFVDVESLKAEPIENVEAYSAPLSFAEAMVKYSLVKTSLNSINAQGNQSSDVLNNSLISRLKAIFECPDKDINSPLQKLAEDFHLDTNTQFKFSNILIEQDGHPGIFRLVNGKYIPTEYANDLISFTLFNGAINQDTDTPVLYSGMTKGDYIGTSWSNYFNRNGETQGVKLANYFLRIPSDAPKTFIIKAPRYIIDSEHKLFDTANIQEYKKFIQDVANKIIGKAVQAEISDIEAIENDPATIKIADRNALATFIFSMGDTTINLVDILNSPSDDDINAYYAIWQDAYERFGKDQEPVMVPVVYNNGSELVTLIVEGYYKNGYLNNVKLVKVITANEGHLNATKALVQAIANNYYITDFNERGEVSYDDLNVRRELEINENHQIFKQLRAAFHQELLDGVTAAKLMFKTDTLKDGEGNPVLVNGKEVYVILRDDKLNPILNDQWKDNLNGLNPIYHFRDGKAYAKGKLTGRVFTSDRFTIVDDEGNFRNYGQELIDTVLKYLATTEDPSTNRLLLWSETEGTPELNLSATQSNIINAKIKEFIRDFIMDSKRRLDENEDFLIGTVNTLTNIADYSLNHMLTYLTSNQLLEGDTKYYKDVLTFHKRAKEYQASGVMYGVANVRQTLTSSPIENIPVGDPAWGVTLNDRFNAVTFHTTNMFRKKVLDGLVRSLTDKKVLGDKALSRAEAEARIYGEDRNGAYTDTNANDAQSYITFEEWIRRVAARGELDEYTPLINKIYNKEVLTANELEQFVQVQKNIYYDLYYDKVTGRVIPRQIKNAEFVLIPQLIEGTELEKIYNFMRANNIHQINTDETSKAANGYIIDLFDENGVIHDDVLASNELDTLEAKDKKTAKDKKKINSAKAFRDLVGKAIQPYSYNFLYEQQKVPQHIFDKNKLAIQIAKKIIDNIEKGHPLYHLKEEYFKVLSANIKLSFNKLMREFNIPLDEHGNLLNTDSSIAENIDFPQFYNKLRRELSRLGLDNNSIDYVTMANEGEGFEHRTIMPNYLGIMLNKLESIVQSIITKNITRQTLNGFHAAQVTNIGFAKLGDKRTITGDALLAYKPEVKNEDGTVKHYAYVECKLCYSALGIDRNSEHYKNMTKEEILQELRDKGLDEFIAYRIPTEGKQSVAIMKVQDLIDDGYGSTIVVPIEWVAQTGSDFDVDSIYGIQQAVNIDSRTGEVQIIEYKTDNFSTGDWFNYVADNLGYRPDRITDDEFDEALSSAKRKAKAAVREKIAANKKEYSNEAEKELFRNLPGSYGYDKEDNLISKGVKGKLYEIHRVMDDNYGKATTFEKYKNQLENELNYLEGQLNRERNKKRLEEQGKYDDVEAYYLFIQEVYNQMTKNADENKELYNTTKNETLKEALRNLNARNIDAYKIAAQEAGLMSEEEFKKQAALTPEVYNTEKARNNRLVAIMKSIMESPYSREENLFRSNFDNITGKDTSSVDKLRNPIDAAKRKNRSAYNILDEADTQEDAMQGYVIKGMSVARDTLCSVCNTIRPSVNSNFAPVVIYDFSHLDDKQFEKKLKELKNRFGKEAVESRVDKDSKTVGVRHSRFGWSEDNKNIDGYFITVYSSQTTAHILDAMKSGPVPNVNTYTFGVYKTLVDIGSRYDTAIGFIMHPAVTTINKYFKRTNSIYAKDINNNYVESALHEYIDKLNDTLEEKLPFNKYTSLADKLQLVNKRFGKKYTTNFAEYVMTEINEKDLALRIKDDKAFAKKVGGETNMVLSDIEHVLNFGKLLTLSNHLTSIQSVTNPDKFGAKQTIFETEKVFRNIIDLINDSYTLGKNGYVNHSLLHKDGQDILESIYPGLFEFYEDNSDIDTVIEKFVKNIYNVSRSKYPILCAHLKYGSATSVVVNKIFFDTQTPRFRKLIYDLEQKFSDGKKLNERLYKEARGYFINSLYRQVPFLISDFVWNTDSRTVDISTEENDTNEEVARIFGYNRTSKLEVPAEVDENGKVVMTDFTVEDVNVPTSKEINDFIKLSPAQKIEFIKTRFKGESIFDYIITRIGANYKTKNTSPGAHLISFPESTQDIDYLRELFNKAFTNTNPLIALTAADIIKYAFIVDGYQFSRNGISKVIPNKILLNNINLGGTDIISQLNYLIEHIDTILDDTDLENFIRSHSTIGQISTKRVEKVRGTYDLGRVAQGIIVIPDSDVKMAEKYVLDQNGNPNSYVKLKFGTETTLYKIHNTGTYYILTPLNLLERNENSNFSANTEYNVYPGRVGQYDYYDDLVNRFVASINPETGKTSVLFSDLIDKTTAAKFKAIAYNFKNQTVTRNFDITADSAIGQNLINRATEVVNDIEKPYRFFYTLGLDSYMDESSKLIVSLPTKTRTKDGEVLGNPTIFKITRVDINSVYRYLVNPNKSRRNLSQYSLEILNSLENVNKTRHISPKYSHMFKIERTVEGSEVKQTQKMKFSTRAGVKNSVISADLAMVRGINYISEIMTNSDAQSVKQYFNNNKIFATEDSAKRHHTDIVIAVAKQMPKIVETIKDSFNQFWEDPNNPNHYFKITDPEVVAEIRRNPALREKFWNTVMNPSDIYSYFDVLINFDVKSVEPELQRYYTEIKQSVQELLTIPEVTAAEQIAIDYLDELSGNPFIEAGFLSVVSGMYKQSRLNALFNDIQEAPNALVQVTMKMIQSNFRASQKATEEDIKQFDKYVSDLEVRAKNEGYSINYDNIFDDYGRFVRHYKQKLVDDQRAFQNKIDTARQNYIAKRDAKLNNEFAPETVLARIEFERANLEYNEWKAKHINQAALNVHNNKGGIEDDGFYNQHNMLVRAMLDNDATKYIYALYNILREKRANLYARYQEDIEDTELEKEIDEVNSKMYNLTLSVNFDEVTYETTPKFEYASVSSNADEMIRRAWNDAAASKELEAFLKLVKLNNNKYWTYQEKPEFQDRVKDKLAILEKYEKRDENGIPTVSPLELDQIEEYKKAKRWLRRNASSYLLVHDTERNDWIEDYNGALHTLFEDSEAQSFNLHNVLRSPKYRDENGVVNGIEVSKDVELVNKIRKHKQAINAITKEPDFSDRVLISVAPKDNLIYTQAYWDNITPVNTEERAAKKQLYRDTVTKINALIGPYYSEATNSIDWDAMLANRTEDEQIAILTELENLYTELDNIASIKIGSKKVAKFIEDNCQTVVNDAQLLADRTTASRYTGRVRDLLQLIMLGHRKDNSEGNNYIYKTLKLKHKEGSEEYKKYVNSAKTEAKRIVDEHSYIAPTKYYYMAKEDAKRKGAVAFRKWYTDNHVYNPYTRQFEPLEFWTQRVLKVDNEDIEVMWDALYSQTNRVVRNGYFDKTMFSLDTQKTGYSNRTGIVTPEDLEATKEYREDLDMTNKDYKEGYGHAENYISGTNAEYDNVDKRNKYEKELSDCYQNIIYTLSADDPSTLHYAKRGWAPARVKGTGFTRKAMYEELLKLIGWKSYDDGRGEESSIIDRAHDKYIALPMMSVLKSTESQEHTDRMPLRHQFNTEEEYIEAKRAWDVKDKEIKDHNLEVHKNLIDRNFKEVMREFISRANKHNTIQHNKANFYFAQKLLGKYGVYKQRFGSEGNFVKERGSSTEETEYLRQIDKHMYDQFTTAIQRMVFNEWKLPQGSLTKYMSLLQAMTSAKFMTLNFKGGLANITYGEASVLTEASAGDYFAFSEYAQAGTIYMPHIGEYLAHMYQDTSISLAGAVIKGFDVVDYDENLGLNFIQDDLHEITKRINDLSYGMQSGGEHFMQNKVLFAMLLSHRVFTNPKANELGQPKYIYKNFHEFIRELEEQTLLELLTDEEETEYKNYKETIMKDANTAKEYVWWRRDFVTDFINNKNFDISRKQQYVKRIKEKRKEAEKEFKDDIIHPTIYSQLKLGSDGKLAFKEDSMLAQMATMRNGQQITDNTSGITENGEYTFNAPTDAMRFLADFRGRVISVNKKIHGVYDKTGRAAIEQEWYGGIVMQYHKHIPIGLAKRYRSKGYFNEERGTIEKGSYVSLLDFLALPFRKQKDMLELTDKQLTFLEMTQNLIKEYVSFAFHLKTNYGVIPEHERANIRRAIGDMKITLSALFACIGLYLLASDDDDKDSWWFNYCFYQADRLATEASQFMPMVLPSEFKKFFNNPVAGFKEVDDILNTASGAVQLLMGTAGLSDYDPKYTSGTNAGRNKLAVYVERNLPYWRGISQGFIYIKDNNKAMKAGKNILSFVDSEKVAEYLKSLQD